ncbi:hypothetical protein GD1_169 [Paraglaciecola Antarctic GD virus 1]|nr:hypothetical protein GD1_169 [Paraglaciecola Antarctic GD virus 1]
MYKPLTLEFCRLVYKKIFGNEIPAGMKAVDAAQAALDKFPRQYHSMLKRYNKRLK